MSAEQVTAIKKKTPAPSSVKALATQTSSAIIHCGLILQKMDEATPEAFAGLVAESSRALADLSKEIDQFGAVRRELDAWAKDARARSTWLLERARAVESMVEAADDLLIAEVDRNPTLPLSGDAFRVLVSRNGGKEALKISLAREDGTSPVRDHVHVSNVLDTGFAFTAGIPPEFLIEESFVRLNTKAIREALEAGAKLPWAKLERGKHVTVKEA